MSKIYAGIGSRRLSQKEWDLCFRTGRWLVDNPNGSEIPF